MKLVKPSVRVSVIGQTFCRSEWKWSDLLYKQMGLIKFSAGACGIDQTSCWSRKDWSKFLWEGLVNLSA